MPVRLRQGEVQGSIWKILKSKQIKENSTKFSCLYRDSTDIDDHLLANMRAEEESSFVLRAEYSGQSKYQHL